MSWRLRTITLSSLPHAFSFLFPPEGTCTQVWSSEPSATAVTRSRLPMLQIANAIWSAKERRATCAEEPTDCPSIGWSWARSRHAVVSLTLCSNYNNKSPPGLIGTNAAPHRDIKWTQGSNEHLKLGHKKFLFNFLGSILLSAGILFRACRPTSVHTISLFLFILKKSEI